jgi:hypothetical protein
MIREGAPVPKQVATMHLHVELFGGVLTGELHNHVLASRVLRQETATDERVSAQQTAEEPGRFVPKRTWSRRTPFHR